MLGLFVIDGLVKHYLAGPLPHKRCSDSQLAEADAGALNDFVCQPSMFDLASISLNFWKCPCCVMNKNDNFKHRKSVIIKRPTPSGASTPLIVRTEILSWDLCSSTNDWWHLDSEQTQTFVIWVKLFSVTLQSTLTPSLPSALEFMLCFIMTWTCLKVTWVALHYFL